MRSTVRLLLAALLTLLACGAGAAERAENPKDQLLDCAGNQKEKIRTLAQKGVPYLMTLLRSEDRIVRYSAMMALGESGMQDKAAMARLLDLCNGKDIEDAYFALIALAHGRAPEANALIARFAKSDTPQLREAACYAIGESRDSKLYPLLDGLATEGDEQTKAIARIVKNRIEKASQERNPPQR